MLGSEVGVHQLGHEHLCSHWAGAWAISMWCTDPASIRIISPGMGPSILQHSLLVKIFGKKSLAGWVMAIAKSDFDQLTTATGQPGYAQPGWVIVHDSMSMGIDFQVTPKFW